MKRFTAAVGLCVSLLLFGFYVFLPTANAEKNLLENLLNLPAPPPPNPLVVNDRKIRPADFLNKNKPPADDATIEDLLAYWQNINQFNEKFTYTPEPSDGTLERLRGEIEKNPELLPSLLNALPETIESASFVKDLYDREMSEKKYERSWRETVKRWLTYHSNYFSDELARAAEQVGDTGEYVTHQDELLALARVDWDKARPILERLLNDRSQPVSQTLARWAFYERAVREKDSTAAEKCRKELQQTVENKSEKPGNRDLAMDALVEAGDFEGRDEWYFSLLEDETLHDLRVGGTSYTGLTTLLNHSPSDKYVAKMLELSKSSNAAVRSAAVRNLSTLLRDKNPEVVEALLPWLENPKWARETNNERRLLVSALREFAMPASVPGLIAVLNEKQSQEIRTSLMTNSMNMNSSTMNANRPMVVSRTVEYYPYRDEAVGALATQKDIRAATPLRMILPQVENWQRGNVVRAILLSRGFSVAEQIEALEFVAKNYNQPSAYAGNMMSNVVRMEVIENVYDSPPVPPMPRIEAREMVDNMTNSAMTNGAFNRPFNPSDIKPLLGAQLVNQPDAEEELVTALIDRIGVLDAKDPQLALGLRKIMQNWNGAAVNRLLLKDLKNNRADTDSVVKLLSLRKELRGKQSDDVYDVRGGTPVALGIAACLIEDANGYDALLAGENTEAKTALLGCARLIRAVLPVRRVAENLKSPNKLLALAAERYLESEDSPEARQIVLALHPNEAKITGARTYFAPDGSAAAANSAYLPALFQSVNESLTATNYYIYQNYSENLIAAEKRLQKEVRENQELLGVYAYADNFVRIYKDRAVFSWQEDRARYRERELEREEFADLKSYLAAERVDELPPFLSECEGECEGKELLMLGRQGGRRVFSLGGEPQPKFFAGLERIFTEMRQPPAKLHYWLEKSVAGLEILFEDENLQAETVWKAGDDFRVLINNQARRKQIDEEIERQDEADEEKIGETAEAEDGYEKYEKLEEERQKRRERREFENYGWYKFAGGKLAGLAEQPNGVEFLPQADGATVRAASGAWKARAAAFEIRGDGEGLYKIGGGRTTKIREGYHDSPLVTANNRWLIATRYAEEEGRQLIRINLTTNKEFEINFEEHPLVEAVAYLPSVNRVLLFGSRYSDEHEEETDLAERAGEYFFLDPETGAIQKVKGEVRPPAQQTFRPLQSNGNVGEFWAAIPDRAKNETQIGVYNQKTLYFKPLIKIPQITFNSMQMWVDAGKVFFVYEGHLLALPLPK